jgi:hypothetical protein
MDTLVKDVKELREKNIRSLVSFAVEGIHEHDEARILSFFEQTIDTIKSQAAPDREGHVALKLTGFMDTGMMTRISTAQDVFLYDILQLDQLRESGLTLTKDLLAKNLESSGV